MAPDSTVADLTKTWQRKARQGPDLSQTLAFVTCGHGSQVTTNEKVSMTTLCPNNVVAKRCATSQLPLAQLPSLQVLYKCRKRCVSRREVVHY